MKKIFKWIFKIIIYFIIILLTLYWMGGCFKMTMSGDFDRMKISVQHILSIVYDIKCNQNISPNRSLYDYYKLSKTFQAFYSPFDNIYFLKKILLAEMGYRFFDANSKEEFDKKSGYEIDTSHPNEIWVYDKYNSKLRAKYVISDEMTYVYGILEDSEIRKFYSSDPKIIFMDAK